jgi:hypothetical protein
MEHPKKNILNTLKKSGSGFSHPEGYFDGLEDRFVNNLKDKKVNQPDETVLQGLEAIGKSHGFTVPIGYFEEDTEKIAVPRSNKVISLFGIPIKKWASLSIAASLLLFFGLRFFTSGNTQTELAELTNSDIENWIDADLISFSSYDIAEAYSDVSLEDEMNYSDEEVDIYIDNIDFENILLEN